MIIDTHIHIYDPTRPEGVPFPEPDDEIYRRVMPEDYRVLVASEGVTGAIIVEASTWVEDNQWVLDVIEDDPFIVGLVGNLDPRAEDFGDHLNRLSPNPLFLGIRPRTHPWEREDLGKMAGAFEKLVEHDLELDSGIGDAVVEIARRLPDLRIVINHCGNVPADGNPIAPERLELMQKALRTAQYFLQGVGFDGFALSGHSGAHRSRFLYLFARRALGSFR